MICFVGWHDGVMVNCGCVAGSMSSGGKIGGMRGNADEGRLNLIGLETGSVVAACGYRRMCIAAGWDAGLDPRFDGRLELGVGIEHGADGMDILCRGGISQT